jgi:transmembrane sensor
MREKGISINKESYQELHEPVTVEADWDMETPRRPRRNFKIRAISLTTLLLAVAAWFVWRPSNTGKSIATNGVADTGGVLPSEISTNYGTRTTQVLPDGSRVWLNAGSKLVFGKNFGENLREVTLTGEAFFDVAKNPDIPFVIHTNTLDIRVLGTQFNVKSYPTDKTTETSLIRGSVEVVVKKRPNEKYVLKPNEKLVVLNDQESTQHWGNGADRLPVKENLIAIKNLTYQQGDTSDIESAWVRNKLSVKDMPFSEMAKIMERWYDVRFEFRNKKLEEVWITGSFDNETLSQALEALQFSFAFNYEINDKTVIVY